MKNNKTIIIVLTLALTIVLVVVLAVAIYLSYFKSTPTPPTTSPDTSSATQLIYKNTKYGFTFDLPLSWQGYSVITDMWKGNSLVQTTSPNSTSTQNESKGEPKDESESGPKLILRNPKWTASAPYEDLPILIFTTAQWNAYTAEQFSIGAAPIKATELARNTTYVFALPARWNFDYSLGYEEAQDIMNGSPLRAFEVEWDPYY